MGADQKSIIQESGKNRGGGAGSYFLQDGFAQLLAIDDLDGHFLAGDAVDAQFDQTCHKVTRDKS